MKLNEMKLNEVVSDVHKLKNNNKMKLNEVMSDVRLMFSTKVTGCKAFKARKLDRQIV